jgi:uncharacterized protein YraI
MRQLASVVVSAVLAFLLPCAAQAQVAFTIKSVHVRAGPDRDYPLVAVVPGRYQVLVQGCLPDYSWCDVIAGPNRGWVFARNVHYAYQNTYVPLATYAPANGIGVLAFSVDDYWGRYYRNRSWYGDRHRWIDRPGPRYYGPGPAPRRYDQPAPRFSGPPPAQHFHGPAPAPRYSEPQRAPHRSEPQPAARLDGGYSPRPGGFAPRTAQPVQREAVRQAPRQDNSGAGTPWKTAPADRP